MDYANDNQLQSTRGASGSISAEFQLQRDNFVSVSAHLERIMHELTSVRIAIHDRRSELMEARMWMKENDARARSARSRILDRRSDAKLRRE